MPTIVPYDLNWPDNFKSIVNIINPVVKDYISSIEHVGSTSISGMLAKPVIDIDIVMKPNTEFTKIEIALEKLGYKHVGNQGIEGREVFKLESNENKILKNIAHHLYVCPYDSTELRKHLKFKNKLINNDILRDEYINIKLEILKEVGYSNRSGYVEMKQNNYNEFYEKVLF